MLHITSLFSEAHKRNYSKGQIILYQGEKTTQVFRIASGYVKVYDITAQGSEKIMIILGPGDLFPLIWTFRGVDSLHYFYETIDESEIAALPRKNLMAALNNDHILTLNTLEYFVDRTKDLMKRIECIENTSAKHKVLQVLDYLTSSHGSKESQKRVTIAAPITQQMIADMAGITRETANLHLNDLETSLVLKADAQTLVVDCKRLQDQLSA